MGDILLWSAQIVIALFEVWLCYQFLFVTVLENERLDKKEKIVEWGNIVVVGVMLSVNRSWSFFSYVMFLVCSIITSMCIIYIRRKNAILDTGLVVLFFSLMSLMDFFFAFIFMFFMHQQFEYRVYYMSSVWQVIIFLLSRLLVLVYIAVIHKKKAIGTDIQEYGNILLGGSLIFHALLKIYQDILHDMVNGDTEIKAVSASFSLIVLIIIVVFIEMVLLKNRAIQKENDFLMLRDEMIERKYQEVAQLIERNRELVHDINNHFIILNGYAETQDYEKIKLYLKKIGASLFGSNVEAWTGNKTLDMLLSQKKSVSEQKNIRFEIQSDHISQLPFSDNEICSLFGNLLDNALEACERMAGKECWISIKIEKQNQMIFIEILNSIDEKLGEKNGEWTSSKADKNNHGYGLKSVNRIVERYEGIISYQISDNIFDVNLSFFDM